MFFFVLLYRRTPDSTRTDTLGPDPTRVRSVNVLAYAARALRRELRGGDLLTLAAALVLAVAVMTAVGTLVNRVTAAVSANAAQIIGGDFGRSEEHTSELQSLMRISYAVFCLKKKKNHYNTSAQETSHS